MALTRAKHGLVVIGHLPTLRRDEKWAKLLQEHSANVVEGFIGAQKWLETQKVEYLEEVMSV